MFAFGHCLGKGVRHYACRCHDGIDTPAVQRHPRAGVDDDFGAGGGDCAVGQRARQTYPSI